MTAPQCQQCGSYNTEVTQTENNGNHGHPGPNEIVVTDYECHDCHGSGEVMCDNCGVFREWRSDPCPSCGSEQVMSL